LKVAGMQNGHEIFSESAVKAIHHYSQGYPRMINSLADNALLLGYSKGKAKITPTEVKECKDDMSLDDDFSKGHQESAGSFEKQNRLTARLIRPWRQAASRVLKLLMRRKA